MKTALGYPDHASTVHILSGAGSRHNHADLPPVITTTAVADMSSLAASVHVDQAVLEYVSRLAEETRRAPELRLGASVRACLALVRASRTWAASQGRHYVLPDDVKQLAGPVLAHRFVLDAEAEFNGATALNVLSRLVADVAPPQERIPA